MLQNKLLVFVASFTVTVVTADSQFFKTHWEKVSLFKYTSGGKRVFAQMVALEVDKWPLGKTGIFTV